MSPVIVLLITVASCGLVLGGLPWLAARARRRGIGGSPLTAFDEIWHPAAHDARVRLEVQDRRMASAPAPGDRPGDPPSR